MSAAGKLQVMCLCADWCGTCRDYRSGFDALADEFPEAVFRWFDIEDQADEMGDLDVENFPTLLIRRGRHVLFFGTMLPHLVHLRRTVQTFLGLGDDECKAYVAANEERRSWQLNRDLCHLGQ